MIPRYFFFVIVARAFARRERSVHGETPVLGETGDAVTDLVDLMGLEVVIKGEPQETVADGIGHRKGELVVPSVPIRRSMEWNEMEVRSDTQILEELRHVLTSL
jgi:hypothetical protein